jgi:hypothetical protein
MSAAGMAAGAIIPRVACRRVGLSAPAGGCTDTVHLSDLYWNVIHFPGVLSASLPTASTVAAEDASARVM